ncbi:hypothetical protein [Streptomyces niveus]|uniref:CHAD domain-containing protein n=1 Tax=Streptomyces niveus TaxID=193462 RepID=A0ABZ1ZYX5_STRNV|nr:hypothetical protein [Streptomyces niveus]
MNELAGIADRLPLSTQIHPEPRSGTSEDLEDAIRDLTRRFTYLAYTVATRDRQAQRYPHRYTPQLREGTAALARAATPTGRALAALGEAVTAAGRLHHLTHSPPGPGYTGDLQHTRTVLADHITQARTQLFAAARQLRADAHRLLATQTPPAPAALTTRPVAAAPSSPRGRSR